MELKQLTGKWDCSHTSDWKAKWIEMANDTPRYSPSPYFRKEFPVTRKIAAARIYVTSHGFYELQLNGKKVGDQVLTPGWTSYSKRLQYQVYDVTKLLIKEIMQLELFLATAGTGEHLPGEITGQFMEKDLDFFFS